MFELLEEYGIDKELYVDVLTNKERTFRINRIKNPNEILFELKECKRDKYFPFIYHCNSQLKIGNTLDYFLGYIHTQSFSSMIPPIILNPKPHDVVLDMCSAPGGKTTEMADFMNNTGMIVANDNKINRLKMLVANMRRLGVENTVVVNEDARNVKFNIQFDKILADVPCSSLGSSLFALKKWTYKRSRDFARIQRKILMRAFDLLKEGGELIYSTCTFIKKENEDVVQFLLDNNENAKLEDISLNFPHERGIDMKEAVRIYPQHVNSEAFFIAKIKKN